MSDEAINRVAEITALPPAVAADLLVRTGGDPERVIQLYFDYEGDVPAVNAALMAGSANASVLDMLEAANDNPFLDDQSGVDDPFDSLIAAVGTDDDATPSVPVFDDADLFAPTFGNSSANPNAALSSGLTFGSMSGRSNSAQNSNRSGSLFGDQLGTGGAVDTFAQPPSDALVDPMEEAQMAPVPANAANPVGDYDDDVALFGEAGLEEEEEEGEGDDAPLFSDFSDDNHNNNDYFSEESDGPSGDTPDWRRDDLRGGVAQAGAPPAAGSAEDRLLVRLRQIDEALGEAMSRLAMVDGPSAGQARAAIARAQTSQRRAVDDAMAVAREQRAREAAVDEALSLATAHARDVVQREGESLAASLRAHVDAEVLSWVRGTADSVAARMLLGRHAATVDREAGLAAREARLQALQGDLEAAAGTVAQSAHYTRSRVIQELIAVRPVIDARRHAYYGRGRELVSFGQRGADGRDFDDDDDDADDDDEVTAGSAPPDYSDLGYGRRYGATPPPGSPTAPPGGGSGGGWQAGRPAPRGGNRSGGYMQQQPQQQQQQQQIRGFRSDEALARLGGSDDEDATVTSPFAVTPAAAEHRRPAPIEAAGANGDYDLTIPSPTVQGILRENLIGMNASDVTVSIPGPSAANDVNVVGQRTYTFVIPSTLATFSNDVYVREDVIAETPSGVISRAEAHHSLWAVTDVRLPINEDFVGAFMAEATVHSDMTHPGLVLFHGVIAEPDAGRLALVREFQAGGTLAERLRPGHAAYVGGNALTDRLLMCFQICRCIQKVHQRGFVDGRITAERVMFERPDGLQPVHLLLSFMSRIAPAAYEPIEDKRLEAFDSNPPLALEPDGVDVSRDIAMFAIVCIDTILGAHGSDPSDLGVVDGLDPDLATALQDAVSTRWADIRPLCRALRDASR